MIGRRQLRGGRRGLRRALQPQHQFDQLLVAQSLMIGTTNTSTKSEKLNTRKRLEIEFNEYYYFRFFILLDLSDN